MPPKGGRTRMALSTPTLAIKDTLGSSRRDKHNTLDEFWDEKRWVRKEEKNIRAEKRRKKAYNLKIKMLQRMLGNT